MKEFFRNILMIIYFLGSTVILLMGILYPLAYGMKDFPNWIGWIVYPTALIIMASQNAALKYFGNNE